MNSTKRILILSPHTDDAELGYNILAGKTKEGSLKSYKKMINKNLPDIKDNPLGNGDAAQNMVKILFESLGGSS